MIIAEIAQLTIQLAEVASMAILVTSVLASLASTGVSTGLTVRNQNAVAAFQGREAERARDVTKAQIGLNATRGMANLRKMIALAEAAGTETFGPTKAVGQVQRARDSLSDLRLQNFGVAERGRATIAAANMRAATAKAQARAAIITGSLQGASTIIGAVGMSQMMQSPGFQSNITGDIPGMNLQPSQAQPWGGQMVTFGTPGRSI